ncbi:MAG: isopeptide-forming domain-containing fimbrial protein [Eggerthellaceae bacterium]|nr:isopeptide-forming domain-containing fimbrial protein [Eggerthellaceae bacterium]
MSKVKSIKFALLALIAALVLAMPTMAFAEGDSSTPAATDTLKVNTANAQGKTVAEGHSYEAYQILDGDYADGVLSNISWGSGIQGADFLAALKADSRTSSAFEGANSAADVAKVLSDAKLGFDADLTKAFGDIAQQYLTGTKVSVPVNKATSITDPGYYLVQDVLPADYYTDDDKTIVNDKYKEYVSTRVILGVYGGQALEVNPKADVPSVDKFVKEENSNDAAADSQIGVVNSGTKDTDGTWGKIGDYEIGQVFDYQLVGSLPTNYADYTTKYWYKFTDTLSAGQTYVGNVKVYVDATEVTDGFTVTAPTGTAGGTLMVEFPDLNKLKVAAADTEYVTVTAASKIYVEYQAKLNENAIVGNAGNPNEVYLEFSNNPNKDHDGEKGKTPTKYTVVFTFKVDNTKIDADAPSTKLPDAQFVLLNSDRTKIAQITDGKFVKWDDAPAALQSDDSFDPSRFESTTIDSKYVVTSVAGGVFNITGLDDGKYYLKEIKAPAQYNLPKNAFEFTIASTYGTGTDAYDGSAQATKELKNLTITNTSGTTAGDVAEGTVAQDITNSKGTTLPSTGGIGTTIFYIVGGGLILAALIALVVRNRKSSTTA